MLFSVSTRYVLQKRFDRGWQRLSDDGISPELKLNARRGFLRGCCCACFGGCKHFLCFCEKTTTCCVKCHCIAHQLLKWWALLGRRNSCINIAHHLYNNSKFWWRVFLSNFSVGYMCAYIFSYERYQSNIFISRNVLLMMRRFKYNGASLCSNVMELESIW